MKKIISKGFWFSGNGRRFKIIPNMESRIHYILVYEHLHMAKARKETLGVAQKTTSYTKQKSTATIDTKVCFKLSWQRKLEKLI